MISHRLLRTALALTVALPFAANATNDVALEKTKLKILACLEPDHLKKESKQAWEWLSSIAVDSHDKLSIPGRIILDQACMTKVTAAGAFGVVSIRGEVCNAKVEEFAAALRRAGVALDSQPMPEKPHVLMASRSAKYTFAVFKGRYVDDNDTFEPGETLSFMCMHQMSGPQ